MEMKLIKNVKTYTPVAEGIKDVLIAGGKIQWIGEAGEGERISLPGLEVIEGTGKSLMPGFIDQHVHITGGGGEGGFKTRVPEISLTRFIESGVTSVLGLLGTDASTRSIENLVAKGKALKEEGMSVYLVSGSYEYPSVNLTGTMKRDVIYIEEMVGGKVALSDHRASQVTWQELARIASEVRVAGMISSKAGILVLHMGSGKEGLEKVFDVIEKTEIPITTMRPTHVNRQENLLEQGFRFAKMGGMIDLTCGTYKDLKPGIVVRRAEKQGVPLENITFSSDGYGSWSSYDEKGNMVKIGVSKVSTLWEAFQDMVGNQGYKIEEALPFFTTNVAKGLRIDHEKGSIETGKDADLLMISNDHRLELVMNRGKIMMRDGKIEYNGTYE